MRNFTDGTLTPDQLHNSKIVFFLGAMAAYNILVQSVRDPKTLPLLTAAIKHEFDKFFDENPGPVKTAPIDAKFH